MHKLNKIIWGLLLVTAGVLFALNAMEITDVDVFFDGWWTLFIIVPCGAGLITKRDKWGSLFGLLLGVFLLLCAQDVWDSSLARKLIIPAFVVFFGIKLIWGGLTGGKVRKILAEKKISGGSYEETCATFSSCNVDYSGKVFEGGAVSAVFGGVKCDLRGAIIEKDCVLKVSAIFGGITVLVPPTVNVQVETTSVFGGVSDKTADTDLNTVTLYITGECMFGGVDIR